jgi:hypothetical protein
MRLRIVERPPIESVDGVRLDCFELGGEYEVGNSLGALFLAEGWAEPMPLDSPQPSLPFSESDAYLPNVSKTDEPPNLIRESHPPFLEHLDRAADYQFRRKPRS